MTNTYRLVQVLNASENLEYSLDKYADYGILEVYSDQIDIEKLRAELKTEYNLTDIIAKEVFEDKKTITLGECPEKISVEENDLKFLVNLKNEDTGLPLDKSALRKLIFEYSKGKEVLDLFGYTGHLAMYSSIAGAESVSIVESNSQQMQKIKKNYEINSMELPQLWDNNYLDFLELATESKTKWDIVIVDLSDYNCTRNNIDLTAEHSKIIKEIQHNLLKPSGFLIFTTNVKHFAIDGYIRPGADKLTNQIIPEAFKPLKLSQAFAFYN